MPNVNFFVDEKTHKKFKIECIKANKDIQEAIIEFMKSFKAKVDDKK